MTESLGLSPSLVSLLEALDKTPSQQLALLVSQHPSLGDHTSFALQCLASATLEEAFGSKQEQDTLRLSNSLANTLRRLVERGDPSLARRLVPTHASLIDLSICCDVRDIFSRLLDVQGTQDLLEVSKMTLQKAMNGINTAHQESIKKLIKAALIFAKLAASVPRRRPPAENAKRATRTEVKTNDQILNGAKMLQIIRESYDLLGHVDMNSANAFLLLQAKVFLLDAAWVIVELVSVSGVAAGSKLHSEKLDPLWKALDVDGRHDGSIPLVDLPMVIDLALCKPLVSLLRDMIRAPKVPPLETISKGLKKTSFSNVDLDRKGEGWHMLITSMQTTTRKNGNAKLIDSLVAILPELGNDIPKLEERLRSPQFANSDLDVIVQKLLDEQEQNLVATADHAEKVDVGDPLQILQSRANIFDNDPLEEMQRLPNKVPVPSLHSRAEDEKQKGNGLSEELKAAILERAQATDSDEEMRDEWDPFATSNLEVSFEDIDEQLDTQTIRMNHPGDQNDHEVVEEQTEIGGTSKKESTQGSAAAERAVERLLITAWKDDGETLFSKNGRSSAKRVSLLNQLNRIPGKAWDNHMVESWGIMFSRNVRTTTAVFNLCPDVSFIAPERQIASICH